MSTAIIILAAGNSSRLGKPKQLLNYNGRALLDIAIAAAVATKFHPIVVVLGAYADKIEQKFREPVFYVLNKDWQNGMSSSISFGLQSALNVVPTLENVILAVADQVHISAEILKELVKKHHWERKNIVTCAYAETTGTPTLFNKKYFEELLSLTGENGAKQLLKTHGDDAVNIPFELGKIDIDTEADYNNLINNK